VAVINARRLGDGGSYAGEGGKLHPPVACAFFHKRLQSSGYAGKPATTRGPAGLPLRLAGDAVRRRTLLFAGLGFLLDRWLHILPALTVTGVLVGGGLSFYSIYRKVLADQAADKAAKDRTGR